MFALIADDAVNDAVGNEVAFVVHDVAAINYLIRISTMISYVKITQFFYYYTCI